jgi:hypothetical protein
MHRLREVFCIFARHPSRAGDITHDPAQEGYLVWGGKGAAHQDLIRFCVYT